MKYKSCKEIIILLISNLNSCVEYMVYPNESRRILLIESFEKNIHEYKKLNGQKNIAGIFDCPQDAFFLVIDIEKGILDKLKELPIRNLTIDEIKQFVNKLNHAFSTCK